MSTELPPTFEPELLADRYGVKRDYVMRRVRAKAWPHIKVGRKVRFTAEHVAQIDQLVAVAPDPEAMHAEDWDRRTRHNVA